FFFRLATGLGGFAFGLLDALTAGAALGFLFGLAPFLDLARACVRQRADAGSVFVLGQRLQHDTGGFARRRGRLRARSRAATGGSLRGDRCGRCLGAGGNRFGRCVRSLGSVATDAALAALLDHDLLGAAVRKTLAYGARLDARLERQGLALDTQLLVAGSILVGHSVVLIPMVHERTVV